MAIKLLVEKDNSPNPPATLHVDDSNNTLFVNGSPAGGGIQQVSINLSTAQLLALGTTPVEIVPAPGDGYMIIPILTTLLIIPGSHIFGVDGGDTVLYNGAQEFSTDHDGSHLAGQIWNEAIPTLGTFSPFLGFVNGQTSVGGFGHVSLGNNQPLNLGGPSLTGGSLLTATVTGGNAGTGYAPGDTGTLSGSGDSQGTYTVLTVSAGAVLTVSVAGGINYNLITNPQSTSISTGAGDGNLQLNITSLQRGNGTAKINCVYRIVPTT